MRIVAVEEHLTFSEFDFEQVPIEDHEGSPFVQDLEAIHARVSPVAGRAVRGSGEDAIVNWRNSSGEEMFYVRTQAYSWHGPRRHHGTRS
jgi:hypothetical protein